MLRKLDCVMVRVDDLATGEAFYTRVFDLRPLWRDESAIGLTMPETDAEIVLQTMDLPPDLTVHYLVDDVVAYAREGRTVRTPPFDVRSASAQCWKIRTAIGSASLI
ncbi:VOC family protein [Actinoplanes sp. TRM 88003]|uniref:VOC family protein n=1 Tax=Paractinoplanes aksuensis TaxID=2939490 RepID=A0ABT1DJR9_9ACTN|nr:VOC family protein [Actinoplanes aksuensis]MCO8270306.1 VOC family protein [Actinoplanes aksuensis]